MPCFPSQNWVLPKESPVMMVKSLRCNMKTFQFTWAKAGTCNSEAKYYFIAGGTIMCVK